jgi:Fur family ferric uptake transcriptional regulator
MKLLADCGLAREIDLADGITRYEHLYNHEHHDHMICMQCGQSIEFYDSDIETVQDEASAQLGFKVLDHKLQIYGLCKNCKKAARARNS